MNDQIPPALDGFAAPSGLGASSGASDVISSSASKGVDALAPAAATKKQPSSTEPPTKRTKKRAPKKGGGLGGSMSTASSTAAEETVIVPLSDIDAKQFEPMSIKQIQLRLQELVDKLPRDLPSIITSDYDPTTNTASIYAPVKVFASNIQICIEEYNLLLSLVSSATYRWGVDRSGASQQNLSVMSAELQQCQEMISNVVSSRLSNVLCPAVDVLVGEIEIVKSSAAVAPDTQDTKKRKLNEEDRLSSSAASNNTTSERRINHYSRPLVDPSYVHLCHCILARNAPLIRHTVATSIHTAHTIIGDYLNAMKKDNHEAGKGGYY